MTAHTATLTLRYAPKTATGASGGSSRSNNGGGGGGDDDNDDDDDDDVGGAGGDRLLERLWGVLMLDPA